MAITKLSELQTAITDRVARADFTAAQTLECVNLCEARMMRELRTSDMETKNAAFSIDGQYVAVPTAMAAVRTFLVTSADSWVLQETSPELIVTAYSNITGPPAEFAVVGSNFMFGPAPDATYTATLIYYALITPLSGANDTNWILQKHPDAYLYGSLVEAGVRLQSQELVQGYAQLFAQALDAIHRQSANKRFGGPALAMRPA